MKKLLGLLICLLCACGQATYAQTVTGQIIATQYQYRVQGFAPNTYTFSGNTCNVSGPNGQFAFAVGTPIRIVDGNPALSETVTPTAVINNNQTCALSIAPLNNHQLPFYLESATGGLQEAINQNLAQPATNTIVLDNAWYQQLSSIGTTAAAVLAAAQGSANLGLEDITQTPTVWYKWSGTQYTAISVRTAALATYSSPGLVAGGICYVSPGLITTDAFAAINACATQLPASGGLIDATALGTANYTVTTQLAAVNQTNQFVALVLNPGTTFTINTSFATPTDSPSSCAVPIGGYSAIIVPGKNSTNANFILGPSARVWDVMCSGSFAGNQESFRLDGVNLEGNASATVMGSLLHLQGLFVGTRISNSGTNLCYANCVEIDPGTSTTISSDLLFDDDTFQDSATTGTYPGAVVTINALNYTGALANIVFLGGAIQYNGPHNPLMVINGQGGTQVNGLSYINDDFETNPASTSLYWSNVDPIQITDASGITFTNLRVYGANNSAAQANAVDIATTNTGVDFGININQMAVYTGAYTCMIRNTAEGTCETGYPNGHGITALPSYTYGQIVPQIRQTNVAPPASSGVCTIGSIWTNSTAASPSTTIYICAGTPGSQTYQALAGGSGGSGTVNNGVAHQLSYYPAATNTVGPAPGVFEVDASMSQTQINTLFSTVPAGSVIVIEPAVGMGISFSNPNNIQVADFRAGAAMTQMTQYGIACDEAHWYVTITSGSNQVNVGSDFGASAVGKYMVFSSQTGYGYQAAQHYWVAQITAYTFPYATLSANAPFSFTGFATFGTLNTANLQAALNASTFAQPLLIPAGCKILTGTLAWNNGQSVIGQQMTSSGFVFLPGDGLQQPDATGLGNATTAGVRVENLSLTIDSGVDPTQITGGPLTAYSSTGTPTTVPPLYRPLMDHMQTANDPLAPGWITGGANGVASTTQNSAVICTPNAETPPVVGQAIMFPYFSSGNIFTSTVSSTAGSCSGGYTARTMAAALPNTSGYTVAQAEWFTGSAIQSTTTTIPTTITYPLTLALTLPIQPVPGWESNVATHGHVKVCGIEADYTGVNGYGTNVLTLRKGPATSAGCSGTTVIAPMNPCPAKNLFGAASDQPWPVTPSINSGDSTPSGANWFPGECGGYAAMSFPEANGNVYYTTGLSHSFIEHVQFNITGTNNNANNTMAYYAAGNTAPYATDFGGLQSNFLTYSIAQGPASAGQHGIVAAGPTGAGNTYHNLSLTATYPLIFVDMQQSSIDTVNSYSTKVSPFDGTNIGTVSCLIFGYTLDEQTGSLVTNVSGGRQSNWNCEPEAGSGIEIPAYAELDSQNYHFDSSQFEGPFTIVGGGANKFENNQWSTPVINYGYNNDWQDITGLNGGYVTNAWASGAQFLNWGTRSSCAAYAGGQGPLGPCGPNFVQGFNGHSMEAAVTGNLTAPYENSLSGMITPGEWNTNGALDSAPMTTGYTVDSTEPFWGSYASCAMGTSTDCQPSHFDGFNGLIWIGPHNRLTNGPYVLEADLKGSAAGSFILYISAGSATGATCSSPGTVTSGTVTLTTSWSAFALPVNLSGYSGCTFSVQFGPTVSGSFTVEVGYFNLVPTPQWSILQVATYTSGNACPAGTVNGMFLGSDTSNVYMCSAGVIKTLPFGGAGGGGNSIATITGDGTASSSSASASVALTVKSINGGTPFTSQATGVECNTTGTGQLSNCTNVTVAGSVQAGTFLQAGVYVVPCTSNTPVFDLSQGNFLSLTLSTGCTAVTSSTVTNLPGTSKAQPFMIQVCQDATGGRPFPNPTWAQGWTPIQQTASQCTSAMYWASNAGVWGDSNNSAMCALSGTSPLACGNAYKGYIVIPSGTNPTMTVNTTAAGAMSGYLFTEMDQIGASVMPNVTCASPSSAVQFKVTADTVNTSFTVQLVGTTTGNTCLFYSVLNP